MRMKRMALVLLAVMVGAAAPLAALAQTEESTDDPKALSASLDLPVLSSYVWRGQVLSDEAVFQPSLTVSEWGFTLNYWASMNLTDKVTGDEFEFSEYDIALSYGLTCPLTGADVTLGVVNYDFPNQTLASADGNIALVNDTRELSLVYALSELPLSPTLSVYYDFKEADAFYGSLGVSHSFELCSAASADLAFWAGAGDSDYHLYYFGVDDSALSDGNVSLSIPWQACSAVTITPAIQYTWLWDSAIEDAADQIYLDKDQVIGSVKASIAF